MRWSRARRRERLSDAFADVARAQARRDLQAGRVQIHLHAPAGHHRGRAPAGFRVYRPLNPTADMLELPRAEYEPLYRAILERLDPRRVVADLHRLAAPHEPVLLCWERPPFSETVWCHRRMVAAWFHETLGLDVPEV